jgi:hypothetical protein
MSGPRLSASTARPRALILPGLYNSGPDHWQTRWEAADPSFQRVNQQEWEKPVLSDWIATLDAAVQAAGKDVVLVAHSSACVLVAAWSQLPKRRVRGALLVAPSDTESPAYPKGPQGFAPMPLGRIPFQSIVVVSSDDPYVSMERAAEFARAWRSTLIGVGAVGHIGEKSGLGSWPQGQAILAKLLQRRSAQFGDGVK